MQLILDDLVFPEGPRWHAGRLWFSDMHSHRVLCIDAAGSIEEIVTLDDSPSGLGWMPDGSLLIVGMFGKKVWRHRDGQLSVHADLESLGVDFLNDMVVDAAGRAYVGCRRARTGPDHVPNELLCLVEPDGRTRVVAEHLLGPNGVLVTPDQNTLVLAETQGFRVSAFDRRPNGDLAGQRLFADLGERHPDGICLDDAGHLWVGTALGLEILRVAPTGEITERVPTGDLWPLACALGGDDGHTLFVCLARTSLEGLRELHHLPPGLPPAEQYEQARRHANGWIGAITVSGRGVGCP